MTETELVEACDRVATALSDLAKAAQEASEAGLSRFSSDLYSVSTRAWRELEQVRNYHWRRT